jgi:hypothetical protein
MKIACVIGIISFVVASCTIRHDIAISTDGSGIFKTSVSISPLFVRYYGDITGVWADDLSEIEVVRIEDIEKSLSVQDGLVVESLTLEGNDRVHLSGSFTDVEKIIRNSKKNYNEVFSFERIGDEGVFSLTVNRETIPDLIALTTLASPDTLGYFLPPKDKPLSRGEYLEFLFWVLEEYGDEETVGEAIESSGITFLVSVPEKIISIQNGKIIKTADGESALFRVPLIETLIRRDEKIYSVRFR